MNPPNMASGPSPLKSAAVSETKVSPFYPGDMVCYKAKKPYEWTPWYGNVLAPNASIIKGTKYKDQEKDGEDKPPAWDFDQGINGTVNVQWCHSSRLGTADEKDVSLHHHNLIQDSYILLSIHVLMQIALVDRNLARGQRVKNAEGLKGTVTSASTRTSVQILNTNHVIDNVPISDLHPVSVSFVYNYNLLHKQGLVCVGFKCFKCFKKDTLL
jgi:hypothetical protein